MTLRRILPRAAFPLLLLAAGLTSAQCNQQCKQVAPFSASDLACQTDDDCMLVWAGTVCCGCNCPDTAANAATQARVQSELSSELNCGTNCECPSTAVARCFAGQCAACASREEPPLPGQPAACAAGDAGTSD